MTDVTSILVFDAGGEVVVHVGVLDLYDDGSDGADEEADEVVPGSGGEFVLDASLVRVVDFGLSGEASEEEHEAAHDRVRSNDGGSIEDDVTGESEGDESQPDGEANGADPPEPRRRDSENARPDEGVQEDTSDVSETSACNEDHNADGSPQEVASGDTGDDAKRPLSPFGPAKSSPEVEDSEAG